MNILSRIRMEIMKWKGFVASINSEVVCTQTEGNVFEQCKICAVSFHVQYMAAQIFNCAGFQGN